MRVDTLKAIASYGFAYAILAVAFYGLVLYPFELAPLVQGALIAWGGAAIAFVFAQESAKATAAQTQRAFDKGLETPTPGTGTTVTPQPNATTTTTVTTEPPAEPEEPVEPEPFRP
jgi:hypothetical protein